MDMFLSRIYLAFYYLCNHVPSDIARFLKRILRKERKPPKAPIQALILLGISFVIIYKATCVDFDDGVSLYVPYNPSFCTGTLSVMAPNQSETDGISLVVREAAIDRRYVSLRDAKKLRINEQEFVRLQILLSLIPDAKK